MFFVERLSSS